MHRQTNINMHGQSISVDARIKKLVILFNSIPGVETYKSCQGSNAHDAYVQFGGEGVYALVGVLTGGIQWQQALWQQKHRHICRGCPSITISLEIDSAGICLRWLPRDYRKVLHIVSEAKRLLASAGRKLSRLAKKAR